PQQGTYRKAWAQASKVPETAGGTENAFMRQGKALIRRSPLLNQLAIRVYGGLKAKGRPAVVARY
ncbi:MAG: hypothetical protein ABIZ80_02620, partial [Bryobacteraceae bacterium]